MTDYATLPKGLPIPVDDGAADHLPGMPLPSIALPATTGEPIDPSALPGRTVIYAYPLTGVPGQALPEGWDDIPGARGCTPQAQSFRDHQAVVEALGAKILGLSSQTPDHQQELAERLGLSFPILSDMHFALTDALRLPTMVVDGVKLLKRLTLVVRDGTIEHAIYPVFPPDQAPQAVIAWLRANPVGVDGNAVDRS